MEEKRSIHFQNVGVWNRSLFKYINKYCMMNKYNGIRRKIENDDYVFDCEELNGKLIILDCFMAFSKVVDKRTFLERLKYAEAYIKRYNMTDYEVIKPKRINNIKELFEELHKTDSINEIDGLVLRNMYDSFQSSRVYKLKSSKLSTIDFRLKDGKLYSWKKNKEIPFRFPLLKDSDSYRNEELHKEKYTKEEIEDIMELKQMNLEGQIIEMSWDGYSWQPLKIRNDKYRPNKIEFAISNAENIYFPLELENTFYKLEDIWINLKEFIISDHKENENFEILETNIKDISKKNRIKINGSNGFKLEIYKKFNLY